MSREPEIGVGLWTMQATPPRRRPHTLLYRELREDARLVERLGFDSLWISEHHVWFDGYCPAPTVATAHALAATDRLRVGTAVILLPLHDPAYLARTSLELHRLAGGRMILGVAAGYRDEEFRAFGLSRSQRGVLMERHLTTLREEWADREHPELLVGGTSHAAIERAARHGAGILFPPPMGTDLLGAAISRYHDAGGRGRVGVMRDVWVARASGDAHAASDPWLWYAHSQYAAMEGLAADGDIRAFAERSTAASIVGTPGEALDRLAPVLHHEPDLLLLRVRWGDQRAEELREGLELLADELLPYVRRVAA